MRQVLHLVTASVILMSCSSDRDKSASESTVKEPATGTTTEIRLASDIEWEQLNPARGDKSPQAGTIWGDRKAGTTPDHQSHAATTTKVDQGSCPICEHERNSGGVPTGFLAKFVDGFSSPPHIHNVTYRAVVLSGLVHNDDPDAASMWMPTGSFWTQPKGEVHITAAKGDDVVALVEIDQGPYLVLPPEEAFDSGERPVNVDVSNIMWVDPKGGAPAQDGVQIAYLWGSLQPGESNGTFLKLPAGFHGSLRSYGETFRAVVITGRLSHNKTDAEVMEPGSYFGSCGETVHDLSVPSAAECLIYIRTNGLYSLLANGE